MAEGPKFTFQADPNSLKKTNNGVDIKLRNTADPVEGANYLLSVKLSSFGAMSVEVYDLTEKQRFKLSDYEIVINNDTAFN